jgi:lysozyme
MSSTASRPYLASIPRGRPTVATDEAAISYAIEIIKCEEGYRGAAYLDAGGIPTIGYGRTGPDVQLGQTTTRTEEERWLEARVKEIARWLDRQVHAPLPPACWAALISWVYNVGQAAAARSTLMRELRAGRLDRVDDELVRWVRVGGSRNRVLDARRRAEAAVWTAGLDGASTEVEAGPRRPVDAAIEPGEVEAEPVDPLATGTGRTAIRVGGAGIAATIASGLGQLALDRPAIWVVIVAAMIIGGFVAWVVFTRSRR